jgi:hypothetical protein
MSSILAPFAVRSYRFQWPSDLATSIGFEMEALILGWYVLSATGSVEWLVVFGSLPWIGALFALFLGMAGDRLGLRALLCLSRGGYAIVAGTLMILTVTGALSPMQVFVLYGITGLMRPSDQAMRNVLIAQTTPPETLMGALGLSRTTGDMAKVLGSLAGAGGVAMIGMGPAYVVVTVLYASAFVLALGLARPPLHAGHAKAHDVLRGQMDAIRYTWGKPDLFGAFVIAFIGNLLAFPFVLGLLPYAAKEFYQVGQAGLGYLAAAFALGALTGSIMVGANMMRVAAGRMMLWSCGVWFVAVLLLGQSRSFAVGFALLFLSGLMQSLCLTPLAAVMLRGSSLEMRGRVMGMRVLAVWGLPLGLLASGPLIAHFGYVACTVLYGSLGLAATLAVAYRCRDDLWNRAAPANSHV